MQSDLYLICLNRNRGGFFMVSNQNQNFYNSYNFIKLSQKYLVEYEIEKASNHDILFQGFNFIYLGFWARNTYIFLTKKKLTKFK